MLEATLDLLNYIEQDSEHTTGIRNAMAEILKKGNASDCEALLAAFIKQPSSFESNYYLLPLIGRLGNKATAAALYNCCIHNGRLIDEENANVLEQLGILELQEALPVLAHYAFMVNDYYCNTYAALGLLKLDCSTIQHEIAEQIRLTYGKNLFKEFVPALVSKLKDKEDFLEKLYQLGATTASADCNAGIILGFSLCGEEGRPYFNRLLFDPNWEANGSSTGTLKFTYQGLINLKITFKNLLTAVLAIVGTEAINYAFYVFMDLLEYRLDDDEYLEGEEAIIGLYNSFFKEHKRLLEIAKSLKKETAFYELKGKFEAALNK